MTEHDKSNPQSLKPLYDPVAGHAPAALVTGPTGAIGRVVCRELVQKGYRVLGLARHADQQARLPYAVVPVLGDVRDPARWDAAITRVDVVIHAALPPGPKGPKDRAYAEREAEELAAIVAGIGTAVRKKKKRMIFTSSASLFEPNKEGWVTETSGHSDRGYGIRQRRIFRAIQEQRRKGLKAIVMCPSFVYGPGGWFEKSVLDPMSRGESRMIGDGNQTMHYIEGSDVGRAYRLAIEHGIDGDDYLIADDTPSTQGAFTRLAAREMGAPAPVSVPEEDLLPVLGEWGLEAIVGCPKVDSSRARERLGWTPQYRTIEEGMPVVVRDYKWRREIAPQLEPYRLVQNRSWT
jgi:nucleoside-diphosphate-sugar epimerase